MNVRTLITHGLAVKKLSPAAGVAALLGLPPDDVARELDALVAEKKVVSARGAFMLTPQAGAELKAAYTDICRELRTNERLLGAYERFEVVNRELKQLVTDWQTLDVAGEKVPNDHSNRDWDDACIDRLGKLHERAEVVLRDLASSLPRLTRYLERLEAALDKVEAGDGAYFSAPKLDSYHTVWFELHEDLLRILGKTRDE